MNIIRDYFFCSGSKRPNCLKTNHICCIHCDVYEKCVSLNKSKVKPCNPLDVSHDDECEFSI